MTSAIDTLIRIANDVVKDEAYAKSVGQAQPTIYGVIANHDYPAPEGYEDGYAIVGYDYDGVLTNQDPAEALLAALFGEAPFDDCDEDELLERRENILYAMGDYESSPNALTRVDAESAIRLLTLAEINDIFEELELAHVVPQQTLSYLEPGAFALTHDGIQRYLELNGHNLPKGAHSYAMTAWRVPEIDDLKCALVALAHETATPVGICPVCQRPQPFDMELVESDDDPNIHKVCHCHACGTTWTETYAHIATTTENKEE